MSINNIIRQIVLDTETTGMNKFGISYEGHRVIEIGAIEMINRRFTGKEFHVYLKPNRAIDFEAFRIHGISDKFLENQPSFSDIADEFLEFIKQSELIIHNAVFDLGFLNHELKIFDVNAKKIESYCTIVDSLKLARKMFPGQRNSLDALCERFFINRDKRNLHNALIDARLLANVFLSMTGGQVNIQFIDDVKTVSSTNVENHMNELNDALYLCCTKKLKIIRANEQEKLAHEKCLDLMQQENKCCIWRKFNE